MSFTSDDFKLTNEPSVNNIKDTLTNGADKIDGAFIMQGWILTKMTLV